MAQRSSIEWTDATWNPVRGCTRVSPGCVNCYAEIMAARFSKSAAEQLADWLLKDNDPASPTFQKPPAFKDQWGHGFAEMRNGEHRWTGKVAVIEDKLDAPLHWRQPLKIFVNSTSDLFHEKLPDETIDRIFAVMALCPHHTFQILTKRPERMRQWLTKDWTYESIYNAMGRLGDAGIVEPNPFRKAYPNGMPWPLPHVWLGTSVEDQERADQRIPDLLGAPAAIRFLSCEPLLGPISLQNLRYHNGAHAEYHNALSGFSTDTPYHFVKTNTPPLMGRRKLDWIIAGGESGHNARPMHPEWARALRDQCAAAGVPFFFKQWGEWTPHGDMRRPDGAPLMSKIGKGLAGRQLDGREHSEFPKGAA